MKKHFMVALAALFLLAPAAVNAEDFYAGASFGRTSAQIDAINFDESDGGYKVFGGYRFHRQFAVELSYVDLTEIGSAENPGWTSVEANGFGAGILGIIPVSEAFDVYGKLGVFFWNADFNTNVAGTIVTVSDDDTDVSYAVGAAYRINDRFTLRGEYEVVNVDFGELNMASLGVAYAF